MSFYANFIFGVLFASNFVLPMHIRENYVKGSDNTRRISRKF